jgi:hypothetical protein
MARYLTAYSPTGAHRASNISRQGETSGVAYERKPRWWQQDPTSSAYAKVSCRERCPEGRSLAQRCRRLLRRKRVVRQQLVDQVHVRQDHAPAAVALQPQVIHRLPAACGERRRHFIGASPSSCSLQPAPRTHPGSLSSISMRAYVSYLLPITCKAGGRDAEWGKSARASPRRRPREHTHSTKRTLPQVKQRTGMIIVGCRDGRSHEQSWKAWVPARAQHSLVIQGPSGRCGRSLFRDSPLHSTLHHHIFAADPTVAVHSFTSREERIFRVAPVVIKPQRAQREDLERAHPERSLNGDPCGGERSQEARFDPRPPAGRMTDEIEKHVLKKYDIVAKLGKGVRGPPAPDALGALRYSGAPPRQAWPLEKASGAAQCPLDVTVCTRRARPLSSSALALPCPAPSQNAGRL